MSVTVRIPAPLRGKAAGQRHIEVAAHSLGALLEEMEAAYPGITERLRKEDGTLRRTLNIYVNGENIRFLEGLGTPLNDGDEVSIVPAIAGGQQRPAWRSGSESKACQIQAIQSSSPMNR